MPDTLSVHVSRTDLHDLEVPDGFTTDGPFDVALKNHGQGVHVHLHLGDRLSEVATLDANNHHVDRQSDRLVYVDVDEDAIEEPIHGKLKVVSAYGAQTRYIDVDLEPPVEETSTVQVDESLAQPQAKPSEPSPAVQAVDDPETFVLVLGGVALAVAALAALVVNSQIVTVGAFVVLAGVLAATYMLVQQ